MSRIFGNVCQNGYVVRDIAARTSQVKEVDAAFVENALAQSLRRFDKGGEAFYDQISALHKSVR
ncbi:MAG: hypothetical protein B7Z49_02085, partial [Hydrogenophilales bacterium 12-63-5]